MTGRLRYNSLHNPMHRVGSAGSGFPRAHPGGRGSAPTIKSPSHSPEGQKGIWMRSAAAIRRVGAQGRLSRPASPRVHHNRLLSGSNQ
eukprot:1195810-Prorocentrum_minimum.AAC.8